jgi:hypothetical protein
MSLVSSTKLVDAEYAQVVEVHRIFVENYRGITTCLDTRLKVNHQQVDRLCVPGRQPQ